MTRAQLWARSVTVPDSIYHAPITAAEIAAARKLYRFIEQPRRDLSELAERIAEQVREGMTR